VFPVPVSKAAFAACYHTTPADCPRPQVAYPLSMLGVSIKAMQQALSSLKT